MLPRCSRNTRSTKVVSVPRSAASAIHCRACQRTSSRRCESRVAVAPGGAVHRRRPRLCASVEAAGSEAKMRFHEIQDSWRNYWLYRPMGGQNSVENRLLWRSEEKNATSPGTSPAIASSRFKRCAESGIARRGEATCRVRCADRCSSCNRSRGKTGLPFPQARLLVAPSFAVRAADPTGWRCEDAGQNTVDRRDAGPQSIVTCLRFTDVRAEVCPRSTACRSCGWLPSRKASASVHRSR